MRRLSVLVMAVAFVLGNAAFGTGASAAKFGGGGGGGGGRGVGGARIGGGGGLRIGGGGGARFIGGGGARFVGRGVGFGGLRGGFFRGGFRRRGFGIGIYPYLGYGYCYRWRRVWTPWGWTLRRVNICRYPYYYY